MLIDPSYFTRPPRKVRNLTLGTAPDPNSRLVREFVQAYIDFYEPRYLTELFGEGNPVLAYAQEKDRNGSLHDEALESLCGRLKESCADYVYYWMLRDAVSQTTIDGETRTKLVDIYVSPMAKQVTAWNDMVKRHQGVAQWLEEEWKGPKLEMSYYMLVKINPFNL